MSREPHDQPEVSVIIPVVERYGDLSSLFHEYADEIRRLGLSSEFIFVVDRRQGKVLPELRDLQRENPDAITLITLGGAFGESASLSIGLKHAKGKTLVTLASYFQVSPEGIGPAFDLLNKGADLVVGRRYPRKDSLFNRMQSSVFHSLVRLFTGTRFKDISCGFRVMRRTVAEELNIYGGLHRFLPVIASRQGFRVREIKLAHRKEDLPTRYYGLALYLKRVLDIMTVFFLLRFTRRPFRFFGFLGLVSAIAGGVITLYLGIYRLLDIGPIADRPLLLLGVLLLVLGVQVLSLGLLGEILIFTHARKMRDYLVAEEIHFQEESTEPSTSVSSTSVGG